MKKRVLRICTILALGFAATHTNASAQETPGIEGAWISNVTVHDCQTGAFIRTVRSLALFIHDGSFTEAGATVTGLVNARSSSVGVWRHAQGKTYNSTFQFVGLTPAGAFATMIQVARTLELDGDHWTAQDFLKISDINGNLLGTACSTALATRAP
ncbi:conserved exported hypothetical protein [Candidatus Sulfopaludibacter sp. SbA6]|nr:conserved exported hypothetical protein [Candidatus Sulfopaludibacter sp. SbA6]